jgi:soluble lytic murein transglycosylase
MGKITDELPRLLRCGLFFILFCVAMPVRADIYMYIDEQGVVHFTNALTATDNDYRVYLKERRPRRDSNSAPEDFEPYIQKAADYHGLSIELLKAIIKAESDFNPLAVSRKGAMGLMQIMPENFKDLDIRDPFDPQENIMGGARYFREMLDRFNGHLPLSLAAYNAGPTAVERYNNRIPPYKETEDYVRRVLHYYYAFKH